MVPETGAFARMKLCPGTDTNNDEIKHLDMLSMLPNYRRATRYRSADGSKPRWLAIHEWDSTDMDPSVGEILLNTEWTKSVMNGIQLFDPCNWELIFEKGNLTEKL
jgi:hypothetical protein